MSSFSHIDAAGNPLMVDVSNKEISHRQATAVSTIQLPKEIYSLLEKDEIHTKKGPVFQTAIIAGISACKQTSSLIPLCHPLPLTSCTIQITADQENQLVIRCEVKVDGKTGVEMEALTGASVAALTVYDMCKAVSQDIVIKETKLIQKSGGKSDVYE